MMLNVFRDKSHRAIDHDELSSPGMPGTEAVTGHATGRIGIRGHKVNGRSASSKGGTHSITRGADIANPCRHELIGGAGAVIRIESPSKPVGC